MKQVIKALFIIGLREILKVLWLFPVKKNRVVFSSYNGKKYACNPMYLFEYIYKHEGHDLEYIWVLNNGSAQLDDFDGVKVIPSGGLWHLFYSLSSRVYITNDGLSSYIPFRKSQLIINTWHGGGVYKSSGLGGNSQLKLADRLSLKLMAKNLSFFLSSSDAFSNNMQKFYLVPSKKMLSIGMPRNDLFFDVSLMDKYRSQVLDQFGISKEVGLVLYTPTFRGDVADSASFLLDIDISRLLNCLEERFGKPFKFMFRAHHSVQQKHDSIDVIDASDYPDSQKLLCAADVLISDYSSILWDFLLTKKPCFVYAPDSSLYEASDRGFSTSINSWPFPIANDNNKLEDNVLEFCNESYTDSVRSHLINLKSHENGQASQNLCNLIVESCD